MVNNYNRWLDSNYEDVQTYNDSIIHSERLVSAIKKLSIGLVNEGNRKANDIHVTITFPEEVTIGFTENEKYAPKYTLPKGVPEHPIKIAEDALKRRDSYSIGDNYMYSRIEERRASLGNIVRISERTVSVKLTSLLQTKSYQVSIDFSFFIMPLQLGEFFAKVKVICEEYTEEQEYELPISVVLV